MIEDQTIDEALIEIMRTKKALEALRKERKAALRYCPRSACALYWQKFEAARETCSECGTHLVISTPGPVLHAAAKRASLDLTRKLADLRAGR